MQTNTNMKTEPRSEGMRQRIDGDAALLSRLLTPYKPHCKYLKSVSLEYESDSVNGPARLDRGPISAHGEFSIPESCYIQDTGHFNAVEFNICYNQIAYYLSAECIRHELLKGVLAWNLEEYFQHQLGSCFISTFSSTFHKPMKSQRFIGRMDLLAATSTSRGHVFLETEVRFGYDENWLSEGTVRLAFVNAGVGRRV
jgi:hypothetical protein